MVNIAGLNGRERGLRRRDIFGRGPLTMAIFSASALTGVLLSMLIYAAFKKGLGCAFHVHLDRVDVAMATLRVGRKSDAATGDAGFGAAHVFRDGVLTAGHVAIAAAAFAAVAAATLQFIMFFASRPGPGGVVASAVVAGNADPLATVNAAVKAATGATLRAFNIALLALGGGMLLASVLAFPGALARVGVGAMVLACTACTALAANVMLTTHEVERRKVPKRKPKSG